MKNQGDTIRVRVLKPFWFRSTRLTGKGNMLPLEEPRLVQPGEVLKNVPAPWGNGWIERGICEPE